MSDSTFFVIVSGSREFYDWRLIFDTLNYYRFGEKQLFLRFGDCKTGADLYADMYACAACVPYQKFAADWKAYDGVRK